MAGMLKKVQDPMMRQYVTQLEGKLSAEMKNSYDRLVISGMKLMWSPQFEKERQAVLQAITGPQDIPKVVAHAAVKVLSIIHNQIKKQEPFESAGPACAVFACQALEYVEAKKDIEITNELFSQTMLMVKEGVFGVYKITPEIMEQVANRKKPGAQPPGAIPAATPPAAPPAAPPAPPVGV